jgi:hypothetical protein
VGAVANTWADVADVADTTGVTVDAADILQAQSAVEIYANRTYDATDGLTARDLAWLKRAVSWQAAWQSQQYGFAARQSASSISADGQSVERATPSDVVLAPLAARALKNLSWKTGTRRLRRVEEPRGGALISDEQWLREASDDDGPWEAL